MNAIQTEVSDGTLVNINVGLKYFAQADIKVLLDQNPTPLVDGVDYEWTSNTVIHFLTGPVPNGVVVNLVRNTESDAMLNIYDGGAPFNRLTLDENFEQLLRLSQEFSEGLGLTGLRQALDMHGNRITNLGDGVDPDDAINVQQLADALARALRVPGGETMNQLPAAAARADKLLTFDGAGQPSLITAASGSAIALALALADPAQGASLVGYQTGVNVRQKLDALTTSVGAINAYNMAWARQPLTTAVNVVGRMLSAQTVNIWEYANLVTSKPTPLDPSTWDWTPALQAALDSVATSSVLPVGPNPCVLVPAGRYKISYVSVPPHAVIQAAGAVFYPLFTQLGSNPASVNPYAAGVTFTNIYQTTKYNGILYRPKASAVPFTTTNWATDSSKFDLKAMFTWGGFNRAHDIIVDMSYTLMYEAAHYVRSRHCQFNGCDVWRSSAAWLFGDPLWKITPANGHLGDSENALNGCATIWCVNAVRAYGQNTILHFNDCFMYSYKPAMSEFDPTNPNLTAWNALPERTFVNCGTLIYLTGGASANFSGVAPLCWSEIQPATLSPYVNSFGRYYISNTHLETGWLLGMEATGAYVPADDFTNILHVDGANGYVSSTAGNFIQLSDDCQQSVVVRDCNFYGVTNNNIVYANHPKARIHIDPESFRNITGDFFECMHGRRPVGYNGMCFANVTNCAVSFNSTTPRSPTMTAREQSDIWTAYESLWYNTANGNFTPQSDVRNARFDLSLTYTGGAATDVTSVVLKVNGTQVDIKSDIGANPSVSLRAVRIPRGAVATIEVSCSASRAATNLPNCRLTVTGNV